MHKNSRLPWRKLFLTSAGLVLILNLVPAASAYNAEVIKLNNEGVKLLNEDNFDAATAKFEAALKLDPLYRLARDNMSVACNNLALKLQDKPREALKWVERAVFYAPTNTTSEANLDGIIVRLGMNPKNFADRVTLGDQAMKNQLLEGAVVHYRAALKLKNDEDVQRKLGAVLRGDFGALSTSNLTNADIEAKRRRVEQLLDEARYREAEGLLDELVKANTGDGIAWYNLGICHQQSGNYSAALADYNMAKMLMPNDSEVQAALKALMGPTHRSP